jgi:hypothetical protein
MNNIKIVERRNQTITCEKIQNPNDNVHIYERQPRESTVYVRNRKGDLISVQTIHGKKSNYKVIYNGRTTIVILDDGNKGIAKCNPKDKYSIQIGHDIALNRATIKQLENEIKTLTK